MTFSTFRLGLIGGGINSAVGRTHFIASQMDGRFQVVSGCFSRNSEINRQTASKWGISSERVYENYHELLDAEQGKLDAVVVLTPTPHHIESVIPALEKGFAVICEKALTSTSSQAEAIVRQQSVHNGFLAVTYNYTGYPMLRELRQMILEKQLGAIRQLHVEMPQDSYIRTMADGSPCVPQSWRLTDSLVPTIYLDLGVHVHHIIDFLVGEDPIGVVVENGQYGKFPGIVDNAVCIASYTNGVCCNIWLSKSAAGYRNGLRIRVFGDRGSAQWYQMDPEHLVFCDEQGRTSLLDRAASEIRLAGDERYSRFKAGHPAGFVEAFGNHYWDIAEQLTHFQKTGRQTSSQFVFSAVDALNGLYMLEAMARSAKSRVWETVTSQL